MIMVFVLCCSGNCIVVFVSCMLYVVYMVCNCSVCFWSFGGVGLYLKNGELIGLMRMLELNIVVVSILMLWVVVVGSSWFREVWLSRVSCLVFIIMLSGVLVM